MYTGGKSRDQVVKRLFAQLCGAADAALVAEAKSAVVEQTSLDAALADVSLKIRRDSARIPGTLR